MQLLLLLGFACLERADLFAFVNGVSVTFPCGSLGQVWYLIVLIPDPCRLSCFSRFKTIIYCGYFQYLSWW